MTMKYSSSYQDAIFRRQVNQAITKVKQILDTTRNPAVLPEDLPHHRYEDKYALATLLTNTALAANNNVLEQLGLSKEHLETAIQWMHQDKKTVTMRFATVRTCSFVEAEEVKVFKGHDKLQFHKEEEAVERQHQHQEPRATTTRTTKTTTTKYKAMDYVTEYRWKLNVRYTLRIFPGTNPDHKSIMLQSRQSSTIITKTGSKTPPFTQETLNYPHLDMDLTWFLQNISPETNYFQFDIDRTDPLTCKTPRRNKQIDQAINFFKSLKEFFEKFSQQIKGSSFLVLSRKNYADPSHKTAREKLFNPILPLFEDSKSPPPSPPHSDQEQDRSDLLLKAKDVSALLKEQVRSLEEVLGSFHSHYAPASSSDDLVSVAEAKLILLCYHGYNLAVQFEMSVDYIEHMLTQQLIVAIGKQVHAKDFEEFTKFHYKNKFFAGQFQPTPFCFTMRGHPGQYPDGILSIESAKATAMSSKMEPIETFARHLGCNEDTPHIQFPLNASTTVLITGDRYLHGWLCHGFLGQNPPQYHLAARARQFSCFLVMVGKMAGPDEFAPQEAIILQNKDEVLIPLLLNQLPTAKEFNDAILSMSPEQQRFSKAFRAMQLDSSVFGVCVVKVKPQLEDVLALPKGSLTKDIKLTQDLLSLFIDYQIPTDLLSFDGPEDTSKVDKLNAVRSHTKAVMDIIESNKKYSMKSEAQKAQMAQVQRAQKNGATYPPDDDASYPPENDSLGVRTTVPMSLGDMMHLPAVAFRKTPEEKICMAVKKEKADGNRSMMRIQAKNIKARQMQQLQDDTFARNMEGFVGGNSQQEPFYPRSCFGDEACAAAPQAPRLIAKSGMKLGRPKNSTNNASMAHSPAQSAANYQSQASGDESNHNQSLLDPSALMGANDDGMIEDHFDFTSIPKVLDTKFEAFDTTRGDNSSVRPTTIDTKGGWLRRHQENLLTAMETSRLGKDEIRIEKNKAFDLLDALTRSGSLPLEHSELHVMVAVTHCFENDVMGTVIQDNVNPIEKVEKSSLIMASTIHNITPRSLLRFHEDAARLQLSFPALFDD